MNRDEINGLIYTLDLSFPLILQRQKPKHREHSQKISMFVCIAFRQPRRHFTYSQNYVIRHPDFNEDMECLSYYDVIFVSNRISFWSEQEQKRYRLPTYKQKSTE